MFGERERERTIFFDVEQGTNLSQTYHEEPTGRDHPLVNRLLQNHTPPASCRVCGMHGTRIERRLRQSANADCTGARRHRVNG